MAIPAGVTRLVVSGKMPGGEIWSNSLWLAGGAPTSNAAATALAASIYLALVIDTDPGPYQYVAQNFWSQATTVEKVTAYSYPNGGSQAAYIGEKDQMQNGSHSTTTAPNQVSMVVSLRTGNAGRRARGRIYLPMSYPTLDATGQFGGEACQEIADAFSSAMRQYETNNPSQKFVVVSSTATATYPITQVVIDTRADVQRRRANRQAINSRVTSNV